MSRPGAFGPAGAKPSWYHSGLDRYTAEVKLYGKPDGTFLLRDSTSLPGSYVLAVSEGKRVSHYVIQYQASTNDYSIGNQVFTNVYQVLEFYKRHILDVVPLTSPVSWDEKFVSGVLVGNILGRFKATYSFLGKDPEDLSFNRGDTLLVIDKYEEQWWRAQHAGNLQIGTIPANYVEEIPLPPMEPAPSEAEKLPTTFARSATLKSATTPAIRAVAQTTYENQDQVLATPALQQTASPTLPRRKPPPLPSTTQPPAVPAAREPKPPAPAPAAVAASASSASSSSGPDSSKVSKSINRARLHHKIALFRVGRISGVGVLRRCWHAKGRCASARGAALAAKVHHGARPVRSPRHCL
eukprot:m.132744 g.132744  ORF g.132744 m.132744 type:complete len:354 (-) comp52395_c0_seq4:353-1414(-)